MTSLRRNRIQHLARRLREMPWPLLQSKLHLAARRTLWWPRVAARRRRPATRTVNHRVGRVFEEFARDLRDTVAAAACDQEYIDSVRRRAKSVLIDRRIPCLGYGSLPVPRGAGWRTDATAPYTWPDSYFAFVNFLTHGQRADVKVPWEISRLQWLVWLAEAAVVCGAESAESAGDRAVEEIERTLAEWTASNPQGFGPNWTVAMEVAIRAINIGIASAIAWDKLSATARSLVQRLLFEHLEYLRAFPEISDHNGNHYLLNVTGFVFLEGIVFAETESSRLARRDWRGELRRQFESSGLHVEHAPLYHRLCCEALVWTVAFASRGGHGVPDELWEIVRGSCDALTGLTMSTDALPVLGDADSGQIVTFGEASRGLDYLRGLVGLRTDVPALVRATAPAAAAATAPLGRAGERPLAIQVGPFAHLRAGAFDVVVRAGPHGLHGRASHDHDDNGSPWIVVNGHDLVVEGGCYAYTRDFGERARDIGSASHNLVLIRERSRFVPMAGSISPTVVRAPVAHSVRVALSPEPALELTVEWIDPDAGRVRHERRITVDGRSTLSIVDQVQLDRPAEIDLYWHFAPAWTLEASGDSTVRLTSPTAIVTLTCEAATDGGRAPLELRVAPFRYAPRYGEAVESRVLHGRLSAGRETRMTTRFTVDDRSA